MLRLQEEKYGLMNDDHKDVALKVHRFNNALQATNMLLGHFETAVAQTRGMSEGQSRF